LAFLACYAVYALVIVVSIIIFSDTPSTSLEFPIWGTLVLVDGLLLFYILNLFYATWKRIGVFFARLFLCECDEFYGDCFTYAKIFNYILSETQVSFRMDTQMIPDDRVATADVDQEQEAEYEEGGEEAMVSGGGGNGGGGDGDNGDGDGDGDDDGGEDGKGDGGR